jgi:hypothetical protein
MGLADLRAPGQPALRQAVDPQPSHDQLDLLLADLDATAVSELSGDAKLPVGAARVPCGLGAISPASQACRSVLSDGGRLFQS